MSGISPSASGFHALHGKYFKLGTKTPEMRNNVVVAGCVSWEFNYRWRYSNEFSIHSILNRANPYQCVGLGSEDQ